jgi:hypothetical protein
MVTKRRKPKSLAREGEPAQKTRRGLEIPVPPRSEFFKVLNTTVTKKPRERREKESG